MELVGLFGGNAVHAIHNPDSRNKSRTKGDYCDREMKPVTDRKMTRR